MASQTERIAALEATLAEAVAKINELVAAQQPLANQIVDAHARIDHAGKMFSELRRALTPKREPSARIPLPEFQAALEDLRADAYQAGSDRKFFPTNEVLARAKRLAQMRADTTAAGG